MTEPCRICGRPAYKSDELGPAHPCCVWWATQTKRPCPACATAQGQQRRTDNKKKTR